jgi:hypothetical protein
MQRVTAACRLSTFVAVLLLLVAPASWPQTAPGACALVTESDVQSVLGTKVDLTPGSLGETQTCTGQNPAALVVVSLFTRTADSFEQREKVRIDALKTMGAQVDVKTSGGITCVTSVFPPNSTHHAFSTSCTVMSKAPKFAKIEVTAGAQKDMVPSEKLRTLAEKMATRF